MGMFESTMNALSWPLEQAKKATPGEDWFDRPDWMPHEAWAASQVAGDLLLDPLNLLPVGLLGKGAKAAMKAGHEVGAGKGMLAGSTKNYIPNFYGLTDGSATSITPVEKAAVQALQKARGMPYDQALGLVRKSKGMAGFGIEGASNALKNMLSPTARALHKEQGMNPAVQKIVADLAKSGNPRDIEKAAANINYLSHMHAQSGRTGPLNPAMLEIAQRSNLESYTQNQPGQISDWMRKHSGTVKLGDDVPGPRGQKNEIAKADADYIENHVLGSWEGADTVVMKRARSGVGGNHYTDMYAGRNPMGRPVASEVVKAMNKYGDDWAQNMPMEGKNWAIKRIDDDGSVWVRSRGRNVGSAVTEGGVNWLAKIDKDGTMMSVISDKHDFLEKPLQAVAGAVNKVPGVNMHPEIMDKSLVAVTPPMYTNVKNLMKKQAKNLPQDYKNIAGVARKPAPKEANSLTLLEEFSSAKPSEMGVKAEQLKQAGMLSGAAAVIGGNE